MAASKPGVYLFFGDDEYSMQQFIAEQFLPKMGDSSMASLNTTRFDGKKINLDEVEGAARSAPFLVERRLVWLVDPLGQFKGVNQQKTFTTLLDALPPSTAVLIEENRQLEATGKKQHWSLKWAAKAGTNVYVKEFLLPKRKLPEWIIAQARKTGGQFDRDAAAELANLIGDDTRTLAQEIEKLLTYVNFKRPVTLDDVLELSPSIRGGEIFNMVDAIGNQNAQVALYELKKLMEVQDPFSIFGMIVRQFRLILQAKEMQEKNATREETVAAMKTHSYVVGKVITQSRNFSMESLEEIYRHLLQMDVGAKSGGMEMATALETFIAHLAG